MKHRYHFGVCFYFLSFLFFTLLFITNFRRILPSPAHKDRTTCKIMIHPCTFFSTSRQVFSSVLTIKEKQCFRSARLELYPSLFACHSDWKKRREIFFDESLMRTLLSERNCFLLVIYCFYVEMCMKVPRESRKRF